MAAVAMVCAAAALPGAARAYEIGPPSPELACAIAAEAEEKAIDYSRRPSTTQVPGGAPVTFSAEAEVPVTFVISLSPTAAAPLLDSGTSAPPGPGNGAVSFSSARAGETLGTLYWTISFQSTALAECASLPARTITLPVRQLTVVAPPVAPAPEPSPAPQNPAPATSKPRCKVPDLLRLTLARAETELRDHHCRLGHVTRPRHVRRHPLVVAAQGAPAGRSEADGAAVALTLGEPRRHRG